MAATGNSDDSAEVLVKGLKRSTSTNTLKYLLENKKRSGGGKIKDIARRSDDEAVVTFHCTADAMSVVERSRAAREGMILEGSRLDISPHSPGIVRVDGLTKSVSNQALELYVEHVLAKTDGEVTHVTRLSDTCADVTIRNPEDAASLVTRSDLVIDGCPMTLAWPESTAEPILSSETMSADDNRQSVMVRGLHPSTSQEELARFFAKETKPRGGHLKALKHFAANGTAFIMFDSCKTARVMARSKSMVLDGNMLQIDVTDWKPREKVTPGSSRVVASPCRDTSITLSHAETVIGSFTASLDPGSLVSASAGVSENLAADVRGLEISWPDPGSPISEEILKLLFENERITGGGIIEALLVDAEQGKAWLTYKETQDANKVLQKAMTSQFTLSGQPLKVKSIDLPVYSHSCAVEVTQLPPGASWEKVELFFQSRKMNGAELEDAHLDKANDRAVLTYKSPEVAKEIAGRRNVELDRCTMALRMLQPACPPTAVPRPHDKDKVHVSNLPPDTTEAALHRYLTDAGGLRVSAIRFASETSSALVEYADIPDFNEVFRFVCLKPFIGRMLSVQRVSIPDSIEVLGTRGLSQTILKLYFESSAESGGGPVKQITVCSNHAIVSFHKKQDMLNVSKRHSHQLDQHVLKVRVHYPFLGVAPLGLDTSSPPPIIPAQLPAPDTPAPLLHYLHKHHQEKLQRHMEKANCRVIWIENPRDVFSVELECTLSKFDHDVRDKTMTWTDGAKHAWTKITTNTYRIKEMNVQEEFWTEFGRHFQPKHEKPVSELKVTADRSEFRMILCGLAGTVNEIYRQMDDVYRKLCCQKEIEGKAISEKMALKPHQLQMLHLLDVERQQKRVYHELRMSTKDNNLILTGLPETVNKVKLEILDKICQLVDRNFPRPDPLVCQLMERDAVKRYISALLKDGGVTSVWLLRRDDVHFWGQRDADIEKAFSIFSQGVQIKVLNLQPEEIKVVDSSVFRHVLLELSQLHGEKTIVKYDMAGKSIKIAATSDCLQHAINYIRDNLKKCALFRKHVSAALVKVKYIQQHMHDDLETIKREFRMHQVTIETPANSPTTIVISGTREGVGLAEEKLQSVVTSLQTRELTVSQPGMPKYFLGPKGKNVLDALQIKYRVVILQKEADSSANPETEGTDVPSMKTICKTTLRSGCEVILSQGDITTVKADVIVNAANQRLDHAGGVAEAIVKKGGASIQEECTAYVRTSGILLPGQVFLSDAGSLPCRKVAHAVGPRWAETRRDQAEDQLYQAVYTSLEQAATCALLSVAIPAIGAGIFGVPVDVSVHNIISAVLAFCGSSEGCSIRKVHLIDTNMDIVKSFRKGLAATLEEGLIKDIMVADSDVNSIQKQMTRINPSSTASPASRLTRIDKETVCTSAGVRIQTVRGNLEKQRVDAIVNSTSSSMDFGGGVSKALADTGGKSLVSEAKKKAPLRYGGVAETDGFGLSCSRVYHTYTGSWDGKRGKCRLNIIRIIKECLKKADAANYNTIAFPALGTGNNRVPEADCAEIMYKEVTDYIEAHPHSSIKEVRFVIFHGNKSTLKSFEAECQRLVTPPKASKAEVRDRKLLTRKSEESESFDESMKLTGLQVTLGSVQLELDLGDITLESTDVIVNSTDRDIDLEKGAVAKTLAQKGGDEFRKECISAAKSGFIKKDGLALTGGGNLNAGAVIHIVPPTSGDSSAWKKPIIKALKLADDVYNFKSISFPALGTGMMTIRGKVIAVGMLDAIAEFAEAKPEFIKLIRIVIFNKQPELLQEFRAVIAEKAAGPKKKAFWNIKAHVQPKHKRQKLADRVVETPAAPSAIVLAICAQSETSIDTVMREINNVCGVESEDVILESDDDQETIKQLTDEQVTRIQKIGRTDGVRIHVERKQRLNRIRLQGDAASINKIVLKIHAIFMEVKEAHKHELLKKQTTWLFLEGDDWRNYPADINAQLERAFLAHKPHHEWKEENGSRYRVTFSTMAEEQLDGAGVKVKVHRESFVPAKSWGSFTSGDADFKLQIVDADTKEYMEMESKLLTSAKGAVKSIVKMERVINLSLEHKYQVERNRLIRAHPKITIERQLWHGTSIETVESINRNGFNRSYCGKNATVFGNGVYFAQEASYSCNGNYARLDPGTGHRHVYYCNVLTGEYTQGASGLRDTPVKHGTVHYDSVVDNTQHPTMFVVFKDDKAYPRYLITFK